MGQQTRLEKEALDYRKENLGKDLYTKDDAYSVTHPNALSDGDAKGKGTGAAAYAYIIPGQFSSKTSYKSTIVTDRGGSSIDEAQRNYMKSVNLYSEVNAYGPESVDTSANVADGQIVVK